MSDDPKTEIIGSVPEGHDHTELKPNGQQLGYKVLTEEERAKGWVRPYRDEYQHVGIRPKYDLRPLTKEEVFKYGDRYEAYEKYPPSEEPLVGKFWSAAELKSGCGTVTRMGRALSETYARDPKFYGGTFCVGCGTHHPVAEFIWTADGTRVGS